MPYSGPGDDKLPDYVKKMGEDKRKQWAATFNGRHKACMDKGADGKECESSAFAVANAAVKASTKNGYDAGAFWDGDAAADASFLAMFGQDVMMRQVDQKTAQYNPTGGAAERACANCRFFISPNRCTIVSQYPIPISPTGISKFWENVVTEPEREPILVQIVGEMEKERAATTLAQPESTLAERPQKRGIAALVKSFLGRDDGEYEGLEDGAFFMTKDATGAYRWIAVVTNKFRDQDNPPDIFSDKAHKEFMGYLDRTKDYPDLWLWHTPGTKWGKADFADYVDGFVIMSGTVEKGHEGIAAKLAKKRDLGVSHGYLYRYEDEKNRIIFPYRTFEISPLPKKAAANMWTSFDIIAKGANMPGFAKDKRDWLSGILGNERVAALEVSLKDAAKGLESGGVEFKEAAPQGGTAPVTAAVPAGQPKAEGAPAVAPAADAKALTDAFTAAFKQSGLMEGIGKLETGIKSIPALVERLGVLEKDMKALKVSDDEKLAALISAKSSTGGKPTGYIPSQAEDNKAIKGDKEVKAGPNHGEEWFKQFSEIVSTGLQTQPAAPVS